MQRRNDSQRRWLLLVAVLQAPVPVLLLVPGYASSSAVALAVILYIISLVLLVQRCSPTVVAETGERALIQVEPQTLAASIAGTLTMGGRNAKRYLDSMPLGLLSVDEQGTIKSSNLTALRLFSCTSDQLEGATVDQLFQLPPHQRRASLQTLKDTAMNRIAEATLLPLAAGSTPVPVDISLAEFSSPAGNGLLVNILDTTARHEVESLRQDFLAMLSHDLRSPLSSLLLYLCELHDHPADKPLLPEQREALDFLGAETRRLIRLVTTFLDVARIRAGKLELHKRSVEITALFSKIKLAAQKQADLKQVAIVVRPIDDYIIADEDRIHQVLENFVSNAIRYAPPGTSVDIEALQTAVGIKLSVSDSGPGIVDDKQSVIFDRFEQATAAEQNAGGTGLGLAICKLIVEQHGGTIGVNSKVGQGSTFWFLLPD